MRSSAALPYKSPMRARTRIELIGSVENAMNICGHSDSPEIGCIREPWRTPVTRTA
jgi:hypothetical protein